MTYQRPPVAADIISHNATNLTNLIVAYSCRSDRSLDRQDRKVGEPHFSLFLSAQRFLESLDLLSIKTIPIIRPEIYSHEISRNFIARPENQLIHLAFGDYATLRPLKLAYNIAYVAWEYDAISVNVDDDARIWHNQKWVLGLFDEIWVGASFVKDAFERAGLQNVKVVPAPVPNARAMSCDIHSIGRDILDLNAASLFFDFSAMDRTIAWTDKGTTSFGGYLRRFAVNKRPTIYLTIINPGDPRKNAEASILGFSQFATSHQDALLVVKLVSDGEKRLSDRLWSTLRLQLNRLIDDGIVKSDNVVFVEGFLTESALMRLVSAADFYISTSFAEGLNLPILEAMSNGTIVISPIHTAMVDYLVPENCVPCEFERITRDGEAICGYPVGPVERYEVTVQNVVDALMNSRLLSDDELQEKRDRALKTILGRYDTKGVAGAIRARFTEILELTQGGVSVR